MALTAPDHRCDDAPAFHQASVTGSSPVSFRLFTKESLNKLQRRIANEQQVGEAGKGCYRPSVGDIMGWHAAGGTTIIKKKTRKSRNQIQRSKPEASCHPRWATFPPELYGKPIEDVDEYYHNKLVSY